MKYIIKPKIEIQNKVIKHVDDTNNLIKEIEIKEIYHICYMFRGE